MTPQPSSPYASRREKLAKIIGDDGVLILTTPQLATRSHDTHYPYRTSSDLYFLTGLTEPEAILVLTPGHDEGDLHLFVQPKDPLREQWEGTRIGPQGAINLFGADQGHSVDDFKTKLPSLIAHRKALYHARGTRTDLDAIIDHTLSSMRTNHHKFAYAPEEVHNPAPLIHQMRAIKDEHELTLMRTSCSIAAKAHALAMAHTRAGLEEYQIQALIEFHFQYNGATAPAYETIVAGGNNANILHYTENKATLKDGDLLLVDAGCEYNYYASDITRTWPVSGKFSPEQRDLYQAVLSLQQELIDACAKHPTFEEISNLYALRSVELLKDLGVLKGDTEDILAKKSHKLYSPHGFGHWLGIDVHDTSPYYNAQGSVQLSPGHVLTIEPGLYIPLESEHVPAGLRGQGVRIEDDILITHNGVEVLTHECPKSIHDIEAITGTKKDTFTI